MSVPVQNFSQIRSAVCLFGLFETHLLPNRQTNSEFIISSLRWRDNWLLYALQHIHSVRASVDQRSLLSTYKSSGSRDRTQWYRVYLLVCRTKRQRGMVCSTVRISRWLCRTATRSASAGMGSSSTVLELNFVDNLCFDKRFVVSLTIVFWWEMSFFKFFFQQSWSLALALASKILALALALALASNMLSSNPSLECQSMILWLSLPFTLTSTSAQRCIGTFSKRHRQGTYRQTDVVQRVGPNAASYGGGSHSNIEIMKSLHFCLPRLYPTSVLRSHQFFYEIQRQLQWNTCYP